MSLYRIAAARSLSHSLAFTGPSSSSSLHTQVCGYSSKSLFLFFGKHTFIHHLSKFRTQNDKNRKIKTSVTANDEEKKGLVDYGRKKNRIKCKLVNDLQLNESPLEIDPLRFSRKAH